MLVGSIGTGNIVEVATALILGGTGAIFWMWVLTLLGAMTIFSENVLGTRYRIKNSDDTWLGGTMYYLKRGVHSKVLTVLSPIGCVLASFGMGNMAQSNPVAGALQSTFGVAPPVIGLVLTVPLVIITFGNIRQIARIAGRLVLFTVISYLLVAGIVLYCHRQVLPEVFRQIMGETFGLRQAAGGTDETVMANTLRTSVSCGVFTNEVGLGSSVMTHSGSTLREPAEQGVWGIFQVFLDTTIMCTVTAPVILCSDMLSSGKDGAALSAAVFSSVFGNYGGALIPVCISLFAFMTLSGWSCYGEHGVRYLVGSRAVPAYRILFALLVIAGCTLDLHLVWGVNDIFNSLAAFPNLIALFLLSGEVLDEITNYLTRYRQEGKAEGKRCLFVRTRHSYFSRSQKYGSNKF